MLILNQIVIERKKDVIKPLAVNVRRVHKIESVKQGICKVWLIEESDFVLVQHDFEMLVDKVNSKLNPEEYRIGA